MEAIQEAFTGICREIFNQHYPDPVYEQLRWVILLGALFAILLPWLCGYRLGEKVPYSKRRHLMFSLLILAFSIISASYDSFGMALLKLLYFPCLFLIEILHYYFRGAIIIGIVSVLFLFSAYIVVLFYLLLKIDRKFVPRDRETTEQGEKQE